MVKKIVSGLFTLAPLVILVSYFMWFVSALAGFATDFQDPAMVSDPDMIAGNTEFIMTVLSIYGIGFVMFIFFVGLIIFYLMDMNKNPKIDKKSAILWTVLMSFFAFIVMPIYWIVHILLYKEEETVEEELEVL